MLYSENVLYFHFAIGYKSNNLTHLYWLAFKIVENNVLEVVLDIRVIRGSKGKGNYLAFFKPKEENYFK